jgi:phosphotransacetylase
MRPSKTAADAQVTAELLASLAVATCGLGRAFGYNPKVLLISLISPGSNNRKCQSAGPKAKKVGAQEFCATITFL